jgi:UPF0176 protein
MTEENTKKPYRNSKKEKAEKKKLLAEAKYKIILFYRYCKIGEENLKTMMITEKAVCDVLGLKGRIILAKEGINGTIEGENDKIEIYKKHILSYKHFKRMNIKESVGNGESFPKMKVKIKDEIVSTKYPSHIDPTVKTGKHINAAEVKKMFKKGEEFYVVDMRNDYELGAGHFKNTINVDWDMKASRDLPNLIKDLEPYKNKKLLTVCTGGVRCEKMSAYLLDQGFKDVSQLHNGIHTYMQQYPGEDFKGTLYTFDNRMTMDFGGEREKIGKCFGCGVTTEEYSHCSFSQCHSHLLMCKECQKEKHYCKAVCVEDEKRWMQKIEKQMAGNLVSEQ